MTQEEREKCESRVIAAIAVLLFVMGIYTGAWLSSIMTGESGRTERTDTVYRDRTVVSRAPVAVHEQTLGWDMVTLPAGHIKALPASCRQVGKPSVCEPSAPDTDTVSKSDSVAIELPLTQRRYEDTLYTAWVSGYRIGDYPRLDSVHITQRTQIITRTIIQAKKRRRWAMGPQFGVGVGKNGVLPYMGVGVTYDILP